MAGAAPTPVGKGGKKALDASINLVPFIDLLSCCISFLLITAVWFDLRAVTVHQRIATDQNLRPSVLQDDQNRLEVVVMLYPNELVAIVIEKNNIPVEYVSKKQTNTYDFNALKQILAQIKEKYPQEKQVILAPSEDSKQGAIIETMDAIKEHSFEVSLSEISRYHNFRELIASQRAQSSKGKK